MLAAGMTQVAAADAPGVTDRTIRNWTKDKAFQTALARAQAPSVRTPARSDAPPADAPGSSNRTPPADPSFAASRTPIRSPTTVTPACR
jgi:hypothetical protein